MVVFGYSAILPDVNMKKEGISSGLCPVPRLVCKHQLTSNTMLYVPPIALDIKPREAYVSL
jgi:hypothetical protein